MKSFDVHGTNAYVASAFSYHREVPFLYCKFQPTGDVEPDLKKEPGGFRVVRSLILFSVSPLYLPANRSAAGSFGIQLSSRRCWHTINTLSPTSTPPLKLGSTPLEHLPSSVRRYVHPPLVPTIRIRD